MEVIKKTFVNCSDNLIMKYRKVSHKWQHKSSMKKKETSLNYIKNIHFLVVLCKVCHFLVF